MRFRSTDCGVLTAACPASRVQKQNHRGAGVGEPDGKVLESYSRDLDYRPGDESAKHPAQPIAQGREGHAVERGLGTDNVVGVGLSERERECPHAAHHNGQDDYRPDVFVSQEQGQCGQRGDDRSGHRDPSREHTPVHAVGNGPRDQPQEEERGHTRRRRDSNHER